MFDLFRVVQNEDWLAVVPFWAVWPFETMGQWFRSALTEMHSQTERFELWFVCVVLPAKRRISSLAELTPGEVKSLAEVTKALLVKYDNLFRFVFFVVDFGFIGDS